MTEEVLHGKPLSLQTTLQLTHRLAIYIFLCQLSKCFHVWYVIRLLYSTLIFSLCSQASLLKARVGNMTHVVQSFQPLCYSNKQLLCVHAQLDSPNSNYPPTPHPPNELAHCGVELILQRQTLMGWFVETWLGKLKAMGNTWVGVTWTDLCWDINGRSSCRLGVLITVRPSNIKYSAAEILYWYVKILVLNACGPILPYSLWDVD